MDGTAAVEHVSHEPGLGASLAERRAPLAGAITRLHTQDADAFCEALRSWSLEVTQLRPGAFEGDAVWLALGPVLVGCANFNQPMALRWSTPDGCVSVSRPGHGSDGVAVNGHYIRDGEVCVAGPNIHGETLTRGRMFGTALSIDLEYLRSCNDWLGDSVQCIADLQTHAAGPDWTSNYLNAIDWIIETMSRCEGPLSRTDVVTSLVDVLLTRVNPAQATQSPLSADREMRVSRRIAVERAREYVDANLTEPIRLSDLCRYSRTQARSLEYGFREVLGLSPIAYVRAIRLHRARRLLRSTAVRSRSISEIALDCGFWHLSQFAVDYKSVFSESPSATYRRTQNELQRGNRGNLASTQQHRPSSTGPVRQVRLRPVTRGALC